MTNAMDLARFLLIKRIGVEIIRYILIDVHNDNEEKDPDTNMTTDNNNNTMQCIFFLCSKRNKGVLIITIM